MEETRELFSTTNNKIQDASIMASIHLSIHPFVYLFIYLTLWDAYYVYDFNRWEGGWAALAHHPMFVWAYTLYNVHTHTHKHTNSRKIRANFRHPMLSSCVHMKSRERGSVSKFYTHTSVWTYLLTQSDRTKQTKGENDRGSENERKEKEYMNKRYTSNFLKLINQQIASQSLKYSRGKWERNIALLLTYSAAQNFLYTSI